MRGYDGFPKIYGFEIQILADFSRFPRVHNDRRRCFPNLRGIPPLVNSPKIHLQGYCGWESKNTNIY